jgi:hypothetical protein
MVKFLVLLLLLMTPLLAGAAVGQTAEVGPGPHGVSVLQLRWEKQVYNPALTEDPMDVSTDSARLQWERREVARANATRNERTGRNPLPPPSEPTTKKERRVPELSSTFYVYAVRVNNSGTKKIRSITWDYVLFDPATRREVGHHLFESKVSIGAGKTKDLAGTSNTPPASVVDVSKSDKEVRGQYSERIDIQRIEYDDGTVWERSPAK